MDTKGDEPEEREDIFFFGQEYLRSANSVQQNVTNLPTLAQRQGNFGAPVCTAYVSGRCVSTTTKVTSIDPTAQQYLTDIINKLPMPNNPNDPQGLITQATGFNDETQTMIRIDHQFTNNLSVFFRYLDDPFYLTVPNGFQAVSAIPGVATSKMTNGSTNWLGHVTWVLGANHVLEGGYSQRANWVTAQAIGYMVAGNSPDIQVKLPYADTIGQVPHLNINGANYAVTSPYNERTPLEQIFVNNTNSLGRPRLSWARNVELMTGGVPRGRRMRAILRSHRAHYLREERHSSRRRLRTFYWECPSTFTQASIDPAPAYRTNIYEGYVQDDFRVSNRLTLTAGMRYTYFAAGSSARLGDGYTKLPVLNFDPDTYSASKAPTLNSQGVICTVAPCAGGKAPNPAYDPMNGIIVGGNGSPYGDTMQETPAKNFAPRVGFTYDVFGNGSMAIRGGFGMYYPSVTGNQIKFAQAQNYPNILNATISNPSFGNPGNGVPLSQCFTECTAGATGARCFAIFGAIQLWIFRSS